MKKKFAVLLCLAMLMTMFAVPAFAADPTVSVVIDSQPVTFDVPPMIDNGRTLVPLRAIFEKMGATVTWDDATKTASAVKGDITVVVAIGSVSPTINGVAKTIDVPAKIVNGRTLAPLRFVCEAFGGTVAWDGATSTASVVSAGGAVVTPPVVTPPVVTPPAAATALAAATGNLSKAAPADVPVNFTWGSAKSVTKVLAGSAAYGLTYDPKEGVDYAVVDNGDGTGVFTIKQALASQCPLPLAQIPTGAKMELTVQFDNGTSCDYVLTVVD